MPRIQIVIDPKTDERFDFTTLLTGSEYNDMLDARAEVQAENAWLRHAESVGWQETALERQIEQARGVISFEDAYAAATGRA